MGRRGRRPKTLPKGTVVYRAHKHILTNEDWYPATNGRVRVSLVGWADGKWRVAVWGADDFGLEKEFDDKTEARREFDRVVDLTTKADLCDRGYVGA